MHKRNILTVLGIAAAFVIAFGGWRLTSALLDRQETHLLAGKGEAPLVVQEADPFVSSKTEEPGGITVDDNESRTSVYAGDNIQLEKYRGIEPPSEEETAAILATWESVEGLPHEPYPGQLTMEEAIQVVEKKMSYLQDMGVLPFEALITDNTRASLNDWIPDRESVSIINSRNSLWTVTLIGRFVEATFVIHALSGQIWMADIHFWIADEYEQYWDLDMMMEDFVRSLSLGDGVSFSDPENGDVYCTFEKGYLYARAYCFPSTLNGEDALYLYVGLETGEPTFG